jgi:Mg-chelatase subunit ChlD|tara:strand:- start:40 stop:735 length:696 start_codon:yes stop_codon:yes gene_type:complete
MYMTKKEQNRVKIWFLLDRSGSMAPVAEDVIGGFNHFLTNQADQAGECRMTVVQFDSEDPFEVIAAGKKPGDVPELNHSVYQPRSMTPLYDSMGRLIKRADERIARRAKAEKPAEDQLVVVFTDGLENDSRRYDRPEIFELVKKRQDEDWTFVFMGANQDSYAEGAKIGLDDGNVQNYSSDSDNVALAYESMNRATSDFRSKPRSQRIADKADFFGGLKEAEQEMRRSKNR